MTRKFSPLSDDGDNDDDFGKKKKWYSALIKHTHAKKSYGQNAVFNEKSSLQLEILLFDSSN